MPKTGEDHHNARLTDNDVVDMRTLRAENAWLWSYGALADYFGCGVSTASDIVNNRTRRDIKSAQVCFAEMAERIRREE